ncbi:hypothetical protein BK816_07530 [Boudabousia tangfeifanii]|uniref:SLH domain-containing protein n=1 Tax=Boudabousia tangfeifanii TaxID=1912795 RepID=A0A1D9MLB8_9ACTO|nr:N-acetylmuramoyl-L-alanine amidase [Boudabousia tangfeifanii]AOZ73161.1 hypothetical protein BK816_07530 [Boudabousia tangfeifanii]
MEKPKAWILGLSVLTATALVGGPLVASVSSTNGPLSLSRPVVSTGEATFEGIPVSVSTAAGPLYTPVTAANPEDSVVVNVPTGEPVQVDLQPQPVSPADAERINRELAEQRQREEGEGKVDLGKQADDDLPNPNETARGVKVRADLDGGPNVVGAVWQPTDSKVRVTYRYRNKEGWSDWKDLSDNGADGPDRGRGRPGSEPAPVAGAEEVEMMLTVPAGQELPKDPRVALITNKKPEKPAEPAPAPQPEKPAEPAPAPQPEKPADPEPAPAPQPEKPADPEPAPAPQPEKPAEPEPAPAPQEEEKGSAETGTGASQNVSLGDSAADLGLQTLLAAPAAWNVAAAANPADLLKNDSFFPKGPFKVETPMPRIHSRAEWGANERAMFWTPIEYSTVKGAIVHHTDGTNNYTPEQVPWLIRNIFYFHANSRGWGDIGYNVIVDKYGRAWQGRAGDLRNRTPQGAHAYGTNKQTFGISVLGNYHHQPISPKARKTLVDILAWKLAQNGVDPKTNMTLVGHFRGHRSPLVTNTISGHRQVGSTDCPGNSFFAQLPGIRDEVARRIDKITAGPYADVLVGHQFEAPITWMRLNHYARGWADGTFRPMAPISREALIAFIYRLSGATSTDTNSGFRDVPSNSLFAKEITWAKRTHISTGWADGTFRPQQQVTREAMAAFLYRLCKSNAELCNQKANTMLEKVSKLEVPAKPEAKKPVTKPTVEPSPEKPVPAKPAPAKPTKPVPSKPVKPAPAKPAPTKPAPTKPTPEKPAPTKPTKPAPKPVPKPAPVKPAPTPSITLEPKSSQKSLNSAAFEFAPATVMVQSASRVPTDSEIGSYDIAKIPEKVRANILKYGTTPTVEKSTPEPKKPAPVKPTPKKPAPVKPAPAKPAPTKPAPAKPAPTKPAPAKPAPKKPVPVKPSPMVPPTQPAKELPATPEPVVEYLPQQIFKDVRAQDLFAREIYWMKLSGISTGWADHTYRPGANTQRQAMAAFLYRLATGK